MKKQKVFFVGIHHKPGMPALSSLTKTGELIDKAIELMNSSDVFKDIDFEFVKTNLFPDEHLPISYEIQSIRNVRDWIKRVSHAEGDIVVTLGAIVRNEFIRARKVHPIATIISMEHPSRTSHKGFLELLHFELMSALNLEK